MDEEFDDFWDGIEPPPGSDELDFGETPEDRRSPGFIAQILAENGIVDLGEIYVDFDAIKDKSEIRGNAFATLEDAILWMSDIGVLSFSDVWIDDDGYFRPVIPESSQGDAD